MKKTLLLIVPLLILFISCNKTPDANDLINKLSEKQHTDFYITWKFSYKNPMKNDTTTSYTRAWAVYRENDTNWYGDVLVTDEYGNTGIYYNGQGYEYNKRRNRLILYPDKYAQYAAYINRSDFITYLLNPDKLRQIINDTTNKVTITDTTYKDHQAWVINIKLPDNADTHNRSQSFFFDKKTYQLLGIENKSYIIWGWSWNSIQIDTFTTGIGKNYIANTLEKIKSTARIDTMKLDEGEEGYNLLQLGTLAPEIYGHIYQTKDTFVLSQQHAKLYVIDFWYQTCQPCMRAIPYLVDLYNNYKDKGLLVLGVNSVDNIPSRYGYLKKFIEFKKITYPVIMTERKVDMSYRVPGYPTLYVLDENHKIIFHEVGFDPEKKLTAIDSIVKARLH